VGPLGLSIHCAPLSVGHSPTPSLDGFGSAIVFSFLSILYYYYSVYNLILNLIERSGWTRLSVFRMGGHIRVWSLFRVILYSKNGDAVLWPQVGTVQAPTCYYIAKIVMRSSGPWLVQCRHPFREAVLWPRVGTM
jgi:hypothetical protein